jgi:hypothetical protein
VFFPGSGLIYEMFALDAGGFVKKALITIPKAERVVVCINAADFAGSVVCVSQACSCVRVGRPVFFYFI